MKYINKSKLKICLNIKYVIYEKVLKAMKKKIKSIEKINWKLSEGRPGIHFEHDTIQTHVRRAEITQAEMTQAEILVGSWIGKYENQEIDMDLKYKLGSHFQKDYI